MGVEIVQVIGADIDETPLPQEPPHFLSMRLAKEKAHSVAQKIDNCFIITADTVVNCHGKMLHKAENNDQVSNYLNILSGRRTGVFTSVCVTKKESGIIVKQNCKLSKTILKIKCLTREEKNWYIESGEGLNVGGGISIEGKASYFIKSLNGSYSGVIGLPLCETISMLKGIGWTQFS